MADDIILVAETGRSTGSPASRRLRATGKVPAVLYGRGAEPAPISVEWRDLRSALTTDKGLNALLTLKIGGKSTKAIVKEMQRHPVRRDVLHIDFLAVDVDKPITTDVPLVLEGEPEKVIRDDGVVEQILNVLIVTAKPDAIPGHIAVDVSDLEIGQHITVGDLQLAGGRHHRGRPRGDHRHGQAHQPCPRRRGRGRGRRGRGGGRRRGRGRRAAPRARAVERESGQRGGEGGE